MRDASKTNRAESAEGHRERQNAAEAEAETQKHKPCMQRITSSVQKVNAITAEEVYSLSQQTPPRNPTLLLRRLGNKTSYLLGKKSPTKSENSGSERGGLIWRSRQKMEGWIWVILSFKAPERRKQRYEVSHSHRTANHQCVRLNSNANCQPPSVKQLQLNSNTHASVSGLLYGGSEETLTCCSFIALKKVNYFPHVFRRASEFYQWAKSDVIGRWFSDITVMFFIPTCKIRQKKKKITFSHRWDSVVRWPLR